MEEDNTPFLLRCFISHAGFSVYAWTTTTLREVAQLLYNADPHISRPLSLHSFRVITPDTRGYTARAATVGVTRIAEAHVNALLLPSDKGDDARTLLREAAVDQHDPANQTLAALGFMPGDYLEVAIDMGRIR
ncbi:hypothetical protein MCUN1_003566 [Malassezia cuniculi]|uniref:Uncharacterized protein n=1 Tax=Malassezia cuniculi TaxID=948313 RepID=A0AAF0EY99_9BASI|nr:hypothetical protein MCUN1_003566 [Malassezia cuniculi]